MTDAGFFRGTLADQDNRSNSKEKRLLKSINYCPLLSTKLNMSKIDIDSLKPWIDNKIKEVLERDDELLSVAILKHLSNTEPDSKSLLMTITNYTDESKASKFMKELWTKLIGLQYISNGINNKSQHTMGSNHNNLGRVETTNEDLKAFERRLTEIISCYQPQTKRWRIVLLIVTLITSITAFQWLTDPKTQEVTFIESLHNHLFFTINCIGLIILFVFGIHRKVVAPAIIVSRIKLVLDNFEMSCDHNGRLILKRSSYK